MSDSTAYVYDEGLRTYTEAVASTAMATPRVNSSDQLDDPPRFLSREACLDVVHRILGFTNGTGETRIDISTSSRGDVRWARNRATHASDWRDNSITIRRSLSGAGRKGAAKTDQLDSESLRSAVEWAERLFRLGYGSESGSSKPDDIQTPSIKFTYPTPSIWSDATYAQSPDDRNTIVESLITSTESAGMLSSGYVAVEAGGTCIKATGLSLYAPRTIAQCSLTVRDPEGSGSGWAGASSYDWNRFDATHLAEVALDKCLRSRNPVAIEPGRYTLIMEPQAVYSLAAMIMRLSRSFNEGFPDWPYFERRDTVPIAPFRGPAVIGITKIGEKVIDERLSISHDPEDPDVGVLPFESGGEPYLPVKWVENGTLVKLAYERGYALSHFRENLGAPNSDSFRMSGGTTSVEDMIATTKRGLIVTRFSKLQLLDLRSLLYTGVTRDGLWLIENGKISKPVKNLRFTESPLFVLNQVEQLGVPVPIFSPESPAVVPSLKVRDFSFTSLIDAV